MAIELAERQGPSLAWWFDRPFAFALWAYRHLQEIDRRKEWIARMHRIEQAALMNHAFHDGKKLEQERQLALADAGPEDTRTAEDLLDIGRKMASEMDRTGVLD